MVIMAHGAFTRLQVLSLLKSLMSPLWAAGSVHLRTTKELV